MAQIVGVGQPSRGKSSHAPTRKMGFLLLSLLRILLANGCEMVDWKLL
jgi:hypothetical protein